MAPVRTGLLGASAAMAVGAVAVASGLVPNPGNGYTFGGGDESTTIEANGTVPDFSAQGASGGPGERGENPVSRDTERVNPPTSFPSSPPAGQLPSQTPADRAPKAPDAASPEEQEREDKATQTPETAPPAGSAVEAPSPSQTAPKAPAKPSTPPTAKAPAKPSTPPAKKTPSAPGKEASVEEQVLALVNQERAKVGCKPVKANAKLEALASDFSRDMAVRGFFSHTSPDGDSPWDRAEAAGISNLGGENIARGQATAEEVMAAWMQSPGHRANILNCDYKTLGVGAHFEPGGPWWTQNFGF
ncbi:CAP domain-containing protein [Streptomyces sp. 549]|uniref:CAP domain-containing protein n=1 Tax=Streptomyces sp. 549 TaxID=3049076 RepID=UPI0024C350A5|nr:CAP domain-containing protein [Streptomyces sp. 549]MDK1475084.1 CAP domain-containing protein [Streptomyces sp. 549]